MRTFNKKIASGAAALAVALAALASTNTQALVIEATVKGSDAIWLAGRTDLTIPAASSSWSGGMVRHGGPTPEEIQETFPQFFGVTAGDVVQVLDPATGGISFFNGFGGTTYGPEGNGIPGSSSITSFGGISGYLGTQGALVGLFLDSTIPSGVPPATLDFTSAGLGVNFASLTPGLNQVFFIGNGINSSSTRQSFTAPTGATRFFIGITDAFGFNGAPGAFDDNDGAYKIKLGINEDPTHPVTPVPEPSTLGLAGLALTLLALRRRREPSAL